MENILLYFAVKYEGDFDKIYNAIMCKEKCDYNLAEQYKKELTCNFTTVISNDYPTKLKNLNNPPFVLFYKGDLSINDKSPL